MMTPDYFGSSVYPNTVFPSAPVMTPANDVGRFENNIGMSARPRKTKRFTTVAIISLFFNLLLTAAITWTATSYVFNRNRVLGVEESQRSTMLQGQTCDLPLTSALCMPCQNADRALLWNGVVVKFRTGTKTLCCRKVEESLIKLSKEMRDVRIFQRKQILTPQKFFNIDVKATGANHGRLHLKDRSFSDTKYTIKEEGMYKLFVAITTVSNDTLCSDSSENYVRVVLEYPEHSLNILMIKKWKCKENRSSGLNYLLPMDISDTFHLPKGGNVFVEVEERSQLYPYDKSNHFGLIKIK